MAPDEPRPARHRDPHPFSVHPPGRDMILSGAHNSQIGGPVIRLQRQWIKSALYIAVASFSCLLFAVYTPPLSRPRWPPASR